MSGDACQNTFLSQEEMFETCFYSLECPYCRWICFVLVCKLWYCPRAPKHALRTCLELEYCEIHLYTKDPAERKRKININLTQHWGIDCDQFIRVPTTQPRQAVTAAVFFLPWGDLCPAHQTFARFSAKLVLTNKPWLDPEGLGDLIWDQQEVKQNDKVRYSLETRHTTFPRLLSPSLVFDWCTMHHIAVPHGLHIGIHGKICCWFLGCTKME